MIRLTFFAGLKDYFPATMDIGEVPKDIGDLRSYLRDQQSMAVGLLAQCRFAVDNTFVTDDYPLGQGDIVLIIPPSSGG